MTANERKQNRYIICNDVDRFEGEPLYTMCIYDIETPVNFHSYDCIYYEQSRDFVELINKTNEWLKKFLEENDTERKENN